MRLLPLLLIVCGVVLLLPTVRACWLVAESGAPDAAAISTSSGLVDRAAAGLLLLLVGVAWLIVRRVRSK